MINITIPDVDMVISKNEIQTIPKKTSGLYFVYDKDKNLLYIGKSVNLKDRVRKHVKGQDMQTANLFSEDIYTISIIFIACPMELDIYETYLINTLKPICNGKKTFLYTPKHIEEWQKQRKTFAEEQQELEKEKFAKEQRQKKSAEGKTQHFEDDYYDEEFQKRMDEAFDSFSI